MTTTRPCPTCGRELQVIPEAVELCDHGESRTLAEEIAAALHEITEEQATQAAEWRNLFVALGRALALAQLGDTAATRAALVDAESVEYSLLGDCDRIGAIVSRLDADAGDGGADTE